MSFQMPPMLVGEDNSDVSADGEGAKNLAMAAGVLTAFAVVGTVALYARDRIVSVATDSAGGSSDDGLSLRGSL